MGRTRCRNTNSGQIPEPTADSHTRAKWAARADETRVQGKSLSPPQTHIGDPNRPRTLTKHEFRTNAGVHRRFTQDNQMGRKNPRNMSSGRNPEVHRRVT
jgi:hypothetical protein